jgi:hypothetical protein
MKEARERVLIMYRQFRSTSVCLRETSVKKEKKARSLSPPSGAPRRIGSVANEEKPRPQFD